MRIRATRNDEGATAVEYAMIIALIAAAIVISVMFLGRSVAQAFTGADDALSGSASAVAATSAAPTGTPSQTSTPTATAAETPSAGPAQTPKSCSPTGYDAGSHYKAPTCDTSTGQWTCPGGFELRTTSTYATCKQQNWRD